MMGKYWKADVLRKLIKLEEELEKESGEKTTITMDYISYLKKMLRLVEEKNDKM